MMDKWIKKKVYVHTMEYSSALRRNEVLTCATTQVSLEDVVPVR
jgi:hypothetical protein